MGKIKQCVKRVHMAYLIDYPLYKVKLALQCGIQQQSEWVELHSKAMTRPLRVGFL